MKNFIQKNLIVLSKTQKKKFLNRLPAKVYRTERNIAIVVVISQLIMITLFLLNQSVSLENKRALYYFLLYIFLFSTTLLAIFVYRYTFRHKKQRGFVWTRRIFGCVICIWCVGITYLEQMKGGNGTTYFYFLPTMAALTLFTPIESTILFGSSWVAISGMFLMNNNFDSAFGNMVNCFFVTVMTLFISYRYYRSMAVEFCDRQLISSQYEEIEKSNRILQQIAHIDQLTNLYNRHYLIEMLYPLFDKYRSKQYYGMFLMVDIDYFKQYNDTYGHIQGDQCIESISREIKRIADLFDLTAIRYGGEEFLIVKMGVKPIDAQFLANTLLTSICGLNILRDDIERKQVTASIGIWNDALLEIPHIEYAIKNSDTALYEAKEAGRNCIVQYEKK